jgi:threonine/homoserine efflux transporter RhtA
VIQGVARRSAEIPAPLLVVGAAFSVQFGAALATTAFDAAGPLGFVWIRVGLAALVLVAFNARPLRQAGHCRFAGWSPPARPSRS